MGSNQYRSPWTPDDEKWIREVGSTYATQPEAWRAFTEATGSSVSLGAYDQFARRLRWGQHVIPRSTARVYTEEILPVSAKGALITSDWHVPYHDAEWAEFAFALAKAYGCDTHVINGDLMDASELSKWEPLLYDATPRIEEEFEVMEQVLAASTKQFAETAMDLGNHEARFWRRFLEAKIPTSRIARMFGADKITMTDFSYLVVNGNVRCTHPKNYSKNPGVVAMALAHKHHQHIVMAHGHTIGYCRDMSGTYTCIDSGGMFDPRRLDYINVIDSSSGRMVSQGFVILTPGGVLKLFDAQNCDRELELWAAKRSRAA